jgi:hypothetical protein
MYKNRSTEEGSAFDGIGRLYTTSGNSDDNRLNPAHTSLTPRFVVLPRTLAVVYVLSDFESGSMVCASYVGTGRKVAYEAENFYRVVAGIGSLVSLCEAENCDRPYASSVVSRSFPEASSARHSRARATWHACEDSPGRLAG